MRIRSPLAQAGLLFVLAVHSLPSAEAIGVSRGVYSKGQLRAFQAMARVPKIGAALGLSAHAIDRTPGAAQAMDEALRLVLHGGVLDGPVWESLSREERDVVAQSLGRLKTRAPLYPRSGSWAALNDWRDGVRGDMLRERRVAQGRLASLPPARAAGPMAALRSMVAGGANFDGAYGAASAPVPAAVRAAPAETEGYVPVADRVARLEKLAKSDVPALIRTAEDYLMEHGERRAEVRIAALHALAERPLEEVSGTYLRFLSHAASRPVQESKLYGQDHRWWYLQREILRRAAREAEAGGMSETTRAAFARAARAAHADWNISVGMAARQTLSALGEDPGEWAQPAVVPAPRVKAAGTVVIRQQAEPSPFETPEGRRFLWSFMAVVLVFAAVVMILLEGGGPFLWGLLVQLAPILGILLLVGVMLHIHNDNKRSQRLQYEQMSKDRQSGPQGRRVSLDFAPRTSSVRFDDVAGVDSARQEVEEMVDFLRHPERFRDVSAYRTGTGPSPIPRGGLLYGPPGSGKTLLAKAVAGESGASFITASGSSFVNTYVGVGASNVRDLFETARKAVRETGRPVVIFIDEFDAVGKARGGFNSNDEREQTLNQLLVEMDGFDTDDRIIVLAATNQPDSLDQAVTRPGRLDRRVYVGAPSALGREAILALHATPFRIAPDADLSAVARRTTGFTGAFLRDVIVQSVQQAIRGGRPKRGVDAATLQKGADRAKLGVETGMRLSEEDKESVAFHEVGHFLTNLLEPDEKLRLPVHQANIMPRSRTLGSAEIHEEDGTQDFNKLRIMARIRMLLGGLVAEELLNEQRGLGKGVWSTGPRGDLDTARRLAQQMFSSGMGLGLVPIWDDAGRPLFGDAVLAQAHAKINELLDQAKQEVHDRLKANWAKATELARALREKEVLSGEEIYDLSGIRPPKKP